MADPDQKIEREETVIEEMAKRYVKDKYFNTTIQQFEIFYLLIGTYFFSILLGTFFGRLGYRDTVLLLEVGYFLALVIANITLIFFAIRKLEKIPPVSIYTQIFIILKWITICALVIYLSKNTYDLVSSFITEYIYRVRVHFLIDSYLRIGAAILMPLFVIVINIRLWFTSKGWVSKMVFVQGPLKRMLLKTQWGALAAYLKHRISDLGITSLSQLDDLIKVNQIGVKNLERRVKEAKVGLQNPYTSLQEELEEVYVETRTRLIRWRALRRDLVAKRTKLVRFFKNTHKHTRKITGLSHEMILVRQARGTGYSYEEHQIFMLDENARVAAGIVQDIAYVANLIGMVHDKIEISSAINKLPRASLKHVDKLERRLSKIRDLDLDI